MEQEEVAIEEREDEMMSAEADALLSELNSDIAYGESLGVFTPSEAAEWYAGAEACTKLSHLEGLLSYIDRFIASGQARLAKLEKAVDNDLLTSSEQIGYLSEGQHASYEDKGELISEINNLIKGLQNLRSELISTLNRKNISASDKSSLISKFYVSSSGSKSGVINDAENISIAEESTEVRSEKSAAPDEPATRPEVVKPPAVSKDPKAECLAVIEQHFKHEQFNQAADLVEASSRYFSLVEYRGLLKRIEKAKLAKEIPALQSWLKAA